MTHNAEKKKLIKQIKTTLPDGSAEKKKAAKLARLTRYELQQIQNLQNANSRNVVLDPSYAVELSDAAYEMIQELGLAVPPYRERVQPRSKPPGIVTPGVTIDATYAVELTEETYDSLSAATTSNDDNLKTEGKHDRGHTARTWFGRLFKGRRRGTSSRD